MKWKTQGACKKLWITALRTDVIWTRNLCMKFEDYRHIGTEILNFQSLTVIPVISIPENPRIKIFIKIGNFPKLARDH